MAVYGIDLGTTYSCLSKFEGDTATVIKTDAEENSLASAVYFGEGGETLVGDDAKGYVQTEGYRVVQFVKREIGKQALPHEIDGKSYNAIEISALILKKIAKYAAEKGEIIKDVVITCPAYFGNEERDATKKAGQLAGFNVLELINEPTAAAISYAYSNNALKDETVVVYDLGGGTFDVTVLDIKVKSNGVPSCSVLATDGDDTLGGKDWDEALFQIIRQKMIEENGIEDLSPEDENAIRSIVEKTKKALTPRETVTARCNINGESMTCEITRQEFEQATAGLLQQTTDCLDRILRAPALNGVKIDKILLVGGSSNMPQVARVIRARYGDSANIDAVRGQGSSGQSFTIPVVFSDPETAVAKGASIYAGMLTKAKRNAGGLMFDDSEMGMEIHDIASRTFGVDVYDSQTEGLKLDNLIFKGDEIPASVTENYYPVRDNQPGVNFFIYESIITDRHAYVPLNVINREQGGEVANPDPAWGLKYLGRLYLKFPPNVTTDTALETTMSVSGAGIHIKVRNTLTGDVEEVDIQFTNNEVDLNNNQINALMIE